ncbi:MAG TPA: threonine/serine exporter family protein [Oscillospiraceae bacterium]|nr:threonine/serine exporter family protein [Oscillospiraceae bacterium]
MDYEKLLNISSDIGYSLLESGAEIYRVEESMHRIFEAYGASGDVYAITNCIIATVCTEDGRSITKTRRLYSHNTNFDKVLQLNELCRHICRDVPDFASVEEELERIRQRPVYGLTLQMAAYASAAFVLTLFFGGTFADACCALVPGASIKLVIVKMSKFHTNSFFMYIVASCLAAILAILSVKLHLGVNSDKIIIGTFMSLVPGIAITYAIRDIIAGDLVAGLSKFTEALFIGIALALGTGIAILATRMIWGA